MKQQKQAKKKMKWWKILLIVLAVILLLAGAGIFAISRMFGSQSMEGGTPSDQTLVQTEKGAVRGSVTDGVYQYLGIPYGTVTERFVSAQEAPVWEDTLDAVAVGPMSHQSGMLGMSGGNQDGCANDCLNLNLWTPDLDGSEPRAVMVWLHGGGFSTGSANDGQYNGAALAKMGDVVVIGINHRLGVSGYFDLSAYGEKYAHSANAGLTDIVMALEWIQKNIASFGGDPENVTLFGQSGGGAKVLAMMTSPYAQGLFHRGIVQSGATETLGVTFTTQEASSSLTERILTILGITADNIEEIQNVPYDRLESAGQQAMQATAEEFQIPAPLNPGYAMEWGPVIDGDYLPTAPVTATGFADCGYDIELLIGSNLNEWSAFMGDGEASEEVQQAYVQAYPDREAGEASQVDTLIRLPMLKIMSHKADQGGANVYSYLFTFSGPMGSYHGAEIPFVFGRGSDRGLNEQMVQLWTSFAKNGVPSAEGIPEWEPYTRDSGATMILDTESRIVHHHDKALMELLAPDYEY